MVKTRLVDIKNEDASYCLQSLMRQLAYLEKNGFSVSTISENDIIGHGCELYPKESKVIVTITLENTELWKKSFEDEGEAIMKHIADMRESTKKELD